MAITSVGFDGTINEQQFAQLMTLAAARYAVASSADLAVVAVPGNRQVSVAPGSAYAAGVLAKSDAAGVINIPTPTAGAWHLIVVHRDWATNTSTLAALPGITTDTTIPTAPPTVLPAMDTTPGVKDDQRLAWVWVNATNTTVLVFDVRDLPPSALGVALAHAADAKTALNALGIFAQPTAPANVPGRIWIKTSAAVAP